MNSKFATLSANSGMMSVERRVGLGSVSARVSVSVNEGDGEREEGKCEGEKRRCEDEKREFSRSECGSPYGTSTH